MGTRRRLVLSVVIGVLVGASWFATAAPASGVAARRAEAAPTTTTTTTLVAISGNYAFSGAVITRPGQSNPRRLNAYQSAVFVQAWLGGLYLAHPRHENPPARLPVYEVDVTGNWAGSIETRAVFYASDGTNAWVAFPPLAPLTSTPTSRRPAVTGWFVASGLAIEGFEGRGKLQLTGGTQTRPKGTTTTASSTTTATTPGRSSGHGSGNDALLWIAIGLAAVAIVGVAVSWLRGRQR